MEDLPLLGVAEMERALRSLVDAGIAIAEDCIGCRRATIEPSWEALEAHRPSSKAHD